MKQELYEVTFRNGTELSLRIEGDNAYLTVDPTQSIPMDELVGFFTEVIEKEGLGVG